MHSSAMPEEAAQLIARLTERLRAAEQLNHELEIRHLELLLANAQLTELVTIDELTGMKNRRFFRNSLERAIDLSVREGQPLSLVTVDLDHFKSYNDTYGHPAGDEVLCTVARILGDGIGPRDIAIRQGGEEFVVLLSAADEYRARDQAERLRAAVAGYPWPRRPITASFGVATIEPRPELISQLMAESDAALYFAKAAGRNRIAHFDDLALQPSPSGSYPRVAS